MRKRYPDMYYGGVHVGEEEARRAMKRGCPPTEVFLSYLAGKKESFLSKTVITPARERKIGQHIQVCRPCRKLMLLLF